MSESGEAMVKLVKSREVDGYVLVLDGKTVQVGDVITQPEESAPWLCTIGYEIVPDGVERTKRSFAGPAIPATPATPASERKKAKEPTD